VDDPDLAAAKAELREELLDARRAMSAEERAAARAAIRAAVLARVDVACVAAYVPLRTEPGSLELLSALVARGVRVLVPITRPDRDLEWAAWSAAGVGASLGMGAVAAAKLVLVPALAVARVDGARLGRGGGSYDRALGRVPAGVPVAALLFDGELRAEVPRGPLDVAVGAAVTPAGWTPVGNVDFPSGR
jgi:5-formyltetrahydrofolate cyclo-ligase